MCCTSGQGISTTPVQANIGLVIDAAISFAAVAFILFMLMKAYNKSKAPEVEEAAGPSEVELLTEIRDSLRAR
jgi:large conductance mechanosensitive channel